MTPLPRNNAGASLGMLLVLVVSAMLAAFNQALGAGDVPIPPEYRWLVPIIGAGITALLAGLTPYLGTHRSDAGEPHTHADPHKGVSP